MLSFRQNASRLFTYFFIVEMIIKLIALGVIGYLNDKMNIFDGTIVILSIVELAILQN